MTEPKTVRPKDRDAVLQSLGAGVVPRRGQHLIQVGRHAEVQALMEDLARIADNGAGVRFVIGSYGSGKTFFLNLIRAVALEKKFVTIHADLTPERRLHSTSGHARSLCAELMRNMATRSKPEGGALPAVVERFVATVLVDAKARAVDPSAVIHERLRDLSEMVGGYDFARVVELYWKGHDLGDENLKGNAVRWLRAEFGTKTEARTALGVRTIVDDETVYDHLKLMARFVRLAGFDGLLVCVDEMVNLYKMNSPQARTANYEQILRIVNDCLQGSGAGLGFLFGGTPEFLTDTRRGLFSYAALQSRLAENTFAKDGLVDMRGPVMRLASLLPEDLYVLLLNIRNVFAFGDPARFLVPDEAVRAFMQHCSERIGDAYFRTPRNSVKEFVHLLSVLEQNTNVAWPELLGKVTFPRDENPDLASLGDETEEKGAAPLHNPTAEDGDGLTSFKL